MQYDPMDDDVRLNRQKREAELDRTGLNRWLAKEISSHRMNQGMSIEDLAKRVGKTPAWIRQLESPTSNPRYNDLQKVLCELRLNLRIEQWPS